MPRVRIPLTGCCLLLTVAAVGSDRVPFHTGSHLQLVRTFYMTGDDSPGGAIRSVAASATDVWAVSAEGELVHLEKGRWTRRAIPSRVNTVFALPGGAGFLAGTQDTVQETAGGNWRKMDSGPTGVTAFCAEPDGGIWALEPRGVWRRDGDWRRIHVVDESLGAAWAICALGPQDVYLASSKGLHGLMGKRKYWMSLEVRPGGLLSAEVRGLARLDGRHFLVATERGLNITNGLRGWRALTAANGLPIGDLTGVAACDDSTLWLATDRGLIRWRDGRSTYLAGRRWLPDDRVTAIAPTSDGSVWVGTRDGLAHIGYRRLTLEEKAAIYQEKVDSRSRRHGYVTQMILPAPGVLDGARQEISDNDGLWTAMYIASQSFQYAATKSEAARARAWRSMRAVLRLESITGIPGFPSRALCHEGEEECARLRSHPEWHPSPVEDGWWWKGDTSSDEIDGHFLAWYVFGELAATEEEKNLVAATCKRVMDHILDHDYHLVDLDGRPTTWGFWAPEKLNDDPKLWEERGLNSLEILSHLKVASHIVGEPRYENAYRELIDRHHYALNVIETRIEGAVSHDDELAFLAFYPLLQLERDPSLRSLYLTGLERLWSFERAESSPLWNFIYGASTGGACDVEAAVGSLREYPLDLIAWNVLNSHRADLEFDPALERRGIRRLARPLSWTERPLHSWDKSPYLLDGGTGRVEKDPTLWLFPYWMGRFHRLID